MGRLEPAAQRLEEELADLTAAIEFVRDHNDLDVDWMTKRAAAKRERFERWHAEHLASPADPSDSVIDAAA